MMQFDAWSISELEDVDTFEKALPERPSRMGEGQRGFAPPF